MKRKRFSEEQIAFALRQAESGTTIEEICRKMGVSEPTFYRWKKVYAGMGVSEIRRLKQLEDENAKLKRVVADLTLDKAMLQDVLRKNVWSAPALQGIWISVGRSLRKCIRPLASELLLQPGHDEMRAGCSQ
jgi:putative transposase